MNHIQNHTYSKKHKSCNKKTKTNFVQVTQKMYWNIFKCWIGIRIRLAIYFTQNLIQRLLVCHKRINNPLNDVLNPPSKNQGTDSAKTSTGYF